MLTLSGRRPLPYRNQSIDLFRKSMDWFLYDNGLRLERVKGWCLHIITWCFASGFTSAFFNLPPTREIFASSIKFCCCSSYFFVITRSTLPIRKTDNMQVLFMFLDHYWHRWHLVMYNFLYPFPFFHFSQLCFSFKIQVIRRANFGKDE